MAYNITLRMERQPSEIALELNERLNTLPEDAQQAIAALSSFFMEEDKFQEYNADPQKIEAVKNQLRQQGLDEEAIGLAIQVIGFTKSPTVDNN